MKHFTFTTIRFLSFRYSLYIFLQSSILDPSKWNLKKNNVMLKIQNSFGFCVHTFHCTLYPFSIWPTMCTHIHFISLLWNLFSVPKLKVVWALTWYLLQIKKNLGKHNGVVQGRRYFTCKEGHGVMVRPKWGGWSWFHVFMIRMFMVICFSWWGCLWLYVSHHGHDQEFFAL